MAQRFQLQRAFRFTIAPGVDRIVASLFVAPRPVVGSAPVAALPRAIGSAVRVRLHRPETELPVELGP